MIHVLPVEGCIKVGILLGNKIFVDPTPGLALFFLTKTNINSCKVLYKPSTNLLALAHCLLGQLIYADPCMDSSFWSNAVVLSPLLSLGILLAREHLNKCRVSIKH